MEHLDAGNEHVQRRSFSPFELLKSRYKKVQLHRTDSIMKDILEISRKNPQQKVKIVGADGTGGFQISFWLDSKGNRSSQKATVDNCRMEWNGDFQGITAKVVEYDENGLCGEVSYSSFSNNSGSLGLVEVISLLHQAKQQAAAPPDYSWHS